MENFADYSVWGSISIIALLLFSLLAANILRKSVPFLQASLIPVSVLGGAILLVVECIYKLITGDVMFDTAFFNGNGMAFLEVLIFSRATGRRQKRKNLLINYQTSL